MDGSAELVVAGVWPAGAEVEGEESGGIVAATERKKSNMYSRDLGSY